MSEEHIKNIQNLMRNASVEITPGVRHKLGSFADVMNPGRRVFVTHLPGAAPEGIIKTSTELRSDGMEPVPHLAARSMTGPAQLHDTLERLRNEADVRDVLLIAGGVDKPAGQFKSTMDMLETGYFEKFGLRSIGIAGHPEGNPDIAEDDIRTALQYKNDYALHHNCHMYIVTQFSFEPQPVIDWLHKIEEWGNRLPVNVGLPGPATLKTLMKYAKMCGVRCSFGFMRKQGLRLFRLAALSTPDYMIAKLAQYYAETPDTLITRLHFYNFGGLKRTMKFIHAVEDGRFDIKPFGAGFRITKNI